MIYYYKRMTNNTQKSENPNLHVIQTNTSCDGFAFMFGNHEVRKVNDEEEIIFILDSGATDHITNNINAFTTYEDLEKPMEIAVAKAGTMIKATKRGTIQVTTDQGVQGRLENVLYAPEVTYNLLSVRRIQESGMTVIFSPKGVIIKNKDKTIIKGKLFNNLIGVNLKIKQSLAYISHNINNYKLWHERLGHISKNKFVNIKTNNLVEDINLIKNIMPTNELCEVCIFGKQTRLPFNKIKKQKIDNRPLFIIHTDLCGPITPSTIDNKNYYLTFIDDFTHYTVTYLITFKWEVMNKFQDFVAKATAHFNLNLVNLYCDNGREYLSNEFKNLCSEKGITYHLTVPHTPQQNGVAERMNRTITEKGRTLLMGSKLNKSFWGEAVLTATYLINRTPTNALANNKTPYELWHKHKPKLNHLKIFGSTVYVHNKTNRSKFDAKSNKTILVGYEPNGYKLWDVQTEKFIIARDVIVDEINFLTSRPKLNEENDMIKNNSTNETDIKSGEVEKLDVQNQDNSTNETDIKSGEVEKLDIQNQENFELRRSERNKNRPLPNYSENENENTHYNLILNAEQFLNKIPESFNDIKDKNDRIKWEQAIKDELNSLKINKTWSLVQRPPNVNIVGCKWVFTLKNDTEGNPSKYKARLVAKGFSQKYLIDYEEIFAPVARMSTFRFILAVAVQYDLLVHHMDVKTAFLNGTLKETIYMMVPEGVSSQSNQVCLLHKSLYGLKQSSRCWYERFDLTLKNKGFKNSNIDHCLYFIDNGDINKNIYVILYVDDLIIVTKNETTMNNFKIYLKQCFQMVDLNEIKLFLGIKIIRNKDQISLDQTAYLKRILNKFNMTDCKPVDTPLPTKLDFENLNSDKDCKSPCRNLIGSLMYAMLCTRPDLCIAVNLLSRYQTKNNAELWKCLKRILRYVKGSLDLKLTYTKNSTYKNEIIGYVDADWANNENDRKSTSGYIFKAFESCSITWNTKRQNTVAVSSTEAEYMALYEGVKEALWLRFLSDSINMKMSKPILIFEDNLSCISIANNPTNHKRTKHIDIKYHFTREKIQQKLIKLEYISTDQQLADIFTKGLAKEKFKKFRTDMGLK